MSILRAPAPPPPSSASSLESCIESVRRPILPVERAHAAHLYPGHVIAPAEPTIVTTILGSCVALCLWDSVRMVGGVNHFLLPDSPVGDRFSGRFATVACARLLDALLASGSDRRNLIAKVFGGACVVDALRDGEHHLGQRNSDAALEFLAREHVAIAARDVGGRYGRKLVFVTNTGDAWVRVIRRGGSDGR